MDREQLQLAVIELGETVAALGTFLLRGERDDGNVRRNQIAHKLELSALRIRGSLPKAVLTVDEINAAAAVDAKVEFSGALSVTGEVAAVAAG